MVKDYLPPTKQQQKKVLDHYLHHDLGMPPLLWCFFAYLLILEYPDHHQNLISSSLCYLGSLHKISSQSVHNFLSNVVHRQTDRQIDRQTNQRYQKHNLLCQRGKNEMAVSAKWARYSIPHNFLNICDRKSEVVSLPVFEGSRKPVFTFNL